MSTGKGLVSKSYLTAIANAIRAKTGSTGTYMPSQMANAINDITTQDNTVLNSILDRSISGDYVNDDLTEIGENAFSGCKYITSATFTKVTEIDYGAFYSCKSLESISLPEVKKIDSSVFSYCPLKSIRIPKIEVLGSADDYWGVFDAYCKMTTINIPSTIQSIGKHAFDGANITTINIDRRADSISGSPWGATGATVNWTGTT